MRLGAYAAVSVALASGCLLGAFNARPNFYSATVHLSNSYASVLLLYNLALVCIVSIIYGLQRLLYGPLRNIEIEQLSEKAWYAVLDTLFAMPSLRGEDMAGMLLINFVLLLAGKVWSWIAEGRVDILEQQPPANPRAFHARLATSLMVSVAFDLFMCRYCFRAVVHDPRPGLMVILAFEYAILTIFSLFTSGRYALALYESLILSHQTRQKVRERKDGIMEERRKALRDAGQNEDDAIEPTDDDVDENEIDVPGWEEKRRWLFGLELVTDAIKIFTYSIFFAISLTFIGFPMHAIRDAYMTVAAFTKRLQDYANYRRATDDMNARYPDATVEELANDNTCIVCREAMVPWAGGAQPGANDVPRQTSANEGKRAKKLPCGHVLHLRCLKAWLERQQSCPTCRRPVVARNETGQAGRRGAQPAQGGNQPGPPGNHAQGGNQNGAMQAPQQPRRNGVRWLRMGPIRVGLYNGPARQLQQALGNNAEGSNSEAQQGPGMIPAQESLRSAELRLLHDAHNLEVDRAQLSVLRALEAELVRLRSLRTTGTSSGQAADPVASNLQPTRTTDNAADATPTQQAASPTGTDRGPSNAHPTGVSPSVQAVQQYQLATDPITGAVNLPAGLTLPDGWSITPLQRTGRLLQAQVPTDPRTRTGPSIPGGMHYGSVNVSTTFHPAQNAVQPEQRPASAPPERSGLASNGSLPETQRTVPDNGAQAPRALASETSAQPLVTRSEPSWSFGHTPVSSGARDDTSASTGARPEQESVHMNGQAEGSGSGTRPSNVQIEDVPGDGNA